MLDLNSIRNEQNMNLWRLSEYQKITKYEWYLKKIPKIVHFYWGAKTLPFLKYLTVFSFMKYNPDWEIRFYSPLTLSEKKTWTTFEHKFERNLNNDYMFLLRKLPLKFFELDVNIPNIEDPREIPEVIKSDYLRWDILSNVGGLWSDMDILYFRSMNELHLNSPENANIDTIVSINDNGKDTYHSIGFMLSSPKNQYYTYIHQKAIRTKINFNSYQTHGSELLNKEFSSPAEIQKRFQNCVVGNIDMMTVYPYHTHKQIPELFLIRSQLNFTSKTIGIHWYAGFPDSQVFLNHVDYNNFLDYKNTILGKIMEHVMKTKSIDLFLELTTKCIYKCVFCHNPKMQPNERRTITLNDIKGIDSLLEYARMVDITGYGEILAHPDFENIIKKLSDKNVPIRFVTNGYLLNEKNRNLIYNSTVDEVVVSLNSLNKHTYKQLMGVDGLEVVLYNINEFVKQYKKTLYFSFVMNAYNFDEVPSFIRLAKHYNKNISCLGLTPTLTYTPDLIIKDTLENRTKIIEWKAYAEKIGAQFNIFNFDTQVGSTQRVQNLSEQIKNCDWVYTKFFINSKGVVTPCCWSKMIMGNIFKQSFEEIWNGDRYTKLRNAIKNGDIAYCKNCRKDG